MLPPAVHPCRLPPGYRYVAPQFSRFRPLGLKLTPADVVFIAAEPASSRGSSTAGNAGRSFVAAGKMQAIRRSDCCPLYRSLGGWCRFGREIRSASAYENSRHISRGRAARHGDKIHARRDTVRQRHRSRHRLSKQNDRRKRHCTAVTAVEKRSTRSRSARRDRGASFHRAPSTRSDRNYPRGRSRGSFIGDTATGNFTGSDDGADHATAAVSAVKRRIHQTIVNRRDRSLPSLHRR